MFGTFAPEMEPTQQSLFVCQWDQICSLFPFYLTAQPVQGRNSPHLEEDILHPAALRYQGRALYSAHDAGQVVELSVPAPPLGKQWLTLSWEHGTAWRGGHPCKEMRAHAFPFPSLPPSPRPLMLPALHSQHTGTNDSPALIRSAPRPVQQPAGLSHAHQCIQFDS